MVSPTPSQMTPCEADLGTQEPGADHDVDARVVGDVLPGQEWVFLVDEAQVDGVDLHWPEVIRAIGVATWCRPCHLPPSGWCGSPFRNGMGARGGGNTLGHDGLRNGVGQGHEHYSVPLLVSGSCIGYILNSGAAMTTAFSLSTGRGSSSSGQSSQLEPCSGLS